MRIWISDAEEGGTHGTNVKSALVSGYGSDISAEINLVESALYSVAQVKADMLLAYNAGYVLFVSSAYGGSNFLTEAKTYYPEMLCVFPNGINDYESNGNYTIPEIAVITGAGDLANETGYPIEFWDNDPISDPNDYSSFSNGVIAGKLLKIKDERNCNWTEAVQCTRATASLSDNLTDKNGYGIIDVNAAIAYSGEIKLTVGGLTVERTSGFSTTVTLERVIDATSYEIDINGTIYTTTSLSYSYTLPTYDRYTFKYRGINANLQSDWSAEATLVYTAGKYLRTA